MPNGSTPWRRSTASGSSLSAAAPKLDGLAGRSPRPIATIFAEEHISIDTIPLVGEVPLADAVRAAARLPRVKALVMAGSLMGGEIELAVREVRAQGILVVSLNMAGSVPEAADLVVTDPVQAGVMTVMAVADTAKFTVERLKRRIF